MSGLFASLSVGRAWEKLSSLLRVFSMEASSSSSEIKDNLEEMRKLERTMRRIRATLHDAEEHWNIREESAKLRLKLLKEVAYDIEDIVEEYEYEVDLRKVEALGRSTSVSNTGKRKLQEESAAYSIDTGVVVAVPNDLVLQARKVTERMNEIIHYSDYLSLSKNDGDRRFTPDITNLRQTSSVACQKNILGRERDKDIIIYQLLSHETENIGSSVSVMAIVGMGGLGKTTLAQLVYNNPRVIKSFNKLAWVCVSERFDVNTITRKIITSLTNEDCNYTAELADLQTKLANEIKESRVLLVLDDVWNERRDCWDLFCLPLSTARICQIIVTTRSEVVARLIQTTPFHQLNCLSFDESWSLFNQAAFIAEQESDTPANLIRMGKRIVQKCKGLPLAIKTLGSMLRYETDERRWENVLVNELWDFEQPRNEVLPALELSYKHMPVHLRRCFISLSLYQKDYQFTDTQVFHLWKVLDLLHCDGNDDEEKIGELYLNELVQRSMIQIHDFVMDSYTLHDLLHDLACFLAGEEFYRLEGDTLTEIPEKVRYLSLHEGITSANISALPHSLRAIIVMEDIPKMIQIAHPESLFLTCQKLRALDLSGSSLVMALPDCIGNLKLLRHLSFDTFWNSDRVQHFQNLVLSGTGKIINLRTFPDIHISRCHCSFNIRELRNINKIRQLKIYGLNKVPHVEYAKEAQLQRKENLRSLCLDFAQRYKCPCGLQPETATILQDQLLDSLRPHHNLRELTIQFYESGKYPSWLGNASFTMLTRIRLYGVTSKHLPKLGGLPSLKYLDVSEMRYVEYIRREFFQHPGANKDFPSLTLLTFGFMLGWSEWSDVDVGELPNLKTLYLTSCSKLRCLPVVPFKSLIALHLTQCDGIRTFPSSPALRELRIEECPGLREFPTLPSLLELYIHNCPNLYSVGFLPSLPAFQLQHCPNPGASAVSSFPKLTTLTLSDCYNLRAVGPLLSVATLVLKNLLKDELIYSLLNHLPSLESLQIYRMAVTCIPFRHESLPSLTRLCLLDCPDLQYCDGLPGLISLQHLEVERCSKLPIYNLHPPQLRTLIINDEDE